MSRLLRVSLALCAVFFVTILSACGSAVPDDSVAKVDDLTISNQAFDRWLTIACFTDPEWRALLGVAGHPEWDLDLGRAVSTARTVDDYLRDGVYRRDFQRGLVLVNPTDLPREVAFPTPVRRVEPQGGGAVGADGIPFGTIRTTLLDRIVVPARSAELLLR